MIKSCKRCVYICHNPDMRQAIARGDTDAVVARLDRPACLGLVNIDMANGDGSGNGGPLHMAADGDAEELVAALLDRGALVNATDAAGETALHLAARRGSGTPPKGARCAPTRSLCARRRRAPAGRTPSPCTVWAVRARPTSATRCSDTRAPTSLPLKGKGPKAPPQWAAFP